MIFRVTSVHGLKTQCQQLKGALPSDKEKMASVHGLFTGEKDVWFIMLGAETAFKLLALPQGCLSGQH
jgi:hypothetical protein